ncbi:MAG TPA: TolC family protein, partial [Verrucomicrobiales bacterium]|nr:TolC family protein [Verrucomicrobiales bacterium]
MFRFILPAVFAASVAGLRAGTFTVEGAAERAVRSNPDLAAARWGIEEARGRLWQSGRPSNPELEAELKPNVRGREFSLSVGFMQKFPLTKRLFLERSVSQAELAVAEAEVRNAERLVRAEARAAAVKLLALQAQRNLQEQQRKNSLKLADNAEEIADKGEGSPLDAIQFEKEIQQLSLAALKAEKQQAEILGTLRPLMGLKATESITISGELAGPSSQGRGATPESRADYQAAKTKEEAARTAIDLARAGKWEDAGFGLTAELNRSEDAPEGLRTDGFI